ncbi:XRE family transcriptional regulator [Pedobacter sp. NJ-S-72]
MNYIKQNIKYLRDTIKLNQDNFGQLIGCSRDNIASYERGTEPKIDTIQNIVNYFHITMDDFINKDFSNSEIHMPSHNNSGLIETTNEFVLRTDTRKELQAIPLYDLNAAASLVTLFEGHQNVIDYISIPNLPKSDGAIYVTGDSMYPLLKSGDIAIYRKINNMSEGIHYGEMHIISAMIDDYLTTVVKFVKKSDKGEEWVSLVSQNAHHASRDIRMDKIKAIALVKASIRINSMM